MPPDVHAVTCLCAAPVATAIAHMTSAAGMAQWNLGMTKCSEVEPGLLSGESSFDGARGWVRPRVNGDGTIDYWVGARPDQLTMRITARVLASESLGYPPGGSHITLTAWRTPAMSDERWQRLIKAHEAEILLIRDQLS